MTLWLAYAKAGKELEVVDALAVEGITAHCAKAVEAKRVGKRRRPDVFVTPLWPNYIFIEADASQYLTAVGVKHLAGTMTAIPTGDVRAVKRALGAASRSFDARMAKIDAGERLDEFHVGQAIKILDGPLSGLVATFRGILQADHDLFPTVEAEIDVMGQTVRARLDPINVRAAE